MRLKNLFVVGLVLAGCAIPTSRRFNLNESFPASHAVTPESNDQARPPAVMQEHSWITVDLPAVLELAGAHDLEIAYARQRIMELKASEDAARYRFFPTLLPGASFQHLHGSYMETEGNFLDVTRQQTIVGTRALLILKLGEAIFDLRATSMDRSAGEFAADQTRHRGLLRAVTTYYELVSAVQEVQIAEEALEFSQANLAYHESRERQGFGVPVDVRRGEARVEADRVAVSDSELRFRAVSAELALQLRLNPKVTLYPGDKELEPVALVPQDQSVDQLISKALAENPALQAADRMLLASESRLNAAHYGWLIPNVVARGNLDERGVNPGSFHYEAAVAVGLVWELSLGQGAQGRGALARRNQAAIQLAQTRERLVKNVVLLKGELDLDMSRIEASGRRVIAGDAALKLAESRMRAGTGLFLEVLDARIDLTEAKLSRLHAITDFNQNQATLLVLTGADPIAPPTAKEQ